MLEEILELSRTNQKILRSPEILFPPEYLEYILKEKVDRNLSARDREVLEELNHYMIDLQHQIMQIREMVEFYRMEKKTIDEDFLNSFMRLLDINRRIQMLTARSTRIIKRETL